jgi:hypoxanthine phosphoribosyltransferase
MGLITVTAEPGCRHEEVARIVAQRLRFELITDARMRGMIDEEYGAGAALPDRAYSQVAASILARCATEHHLIACMHGADGLAKYFQGCLRVRLFASDSKRIGTMMVDRRLDRPAAKKLLGELDAKWREFRKVKLGRAPVRYSDFDLAINADNLDAEHIAEAIEAMARSVQLIEHGTLAPAAEAHLQFQLRLQLSKHGIAPKGKATLKRIGFSHPSEEVFANLLDFYRIGWEYEPHSFPIQWSKDGKVLEAFTPDFYLPEVDMYVELTTMKQANVTRKNRKVKLLREIYPQINIQVFYQKDIQNLIFKYGLAERVLQA